MYPSPAVGQSNGSEIQLYVLVYSVFAGFVKMSVDLLETNLQVVPTCK